MSLYGIGISTILKFVILAIIYIIIFRIIGIMYIDLKKRDEYYHEDLGLALEVLDAPDNFNISRGSVFPIGDSITIGRKEDNTIQINDPFVSNYHARIIYDDDFLYLKDLESTNGTFLNGQRVTRITKISQGDIIEIGRVTFKVI